MKQEAHYDTYLVPLHFVTTRSLTENDCKINSWEVFTTQIQVLVCPKMNIVIWFPLGLVMGGFPLVVILVTFCN